MLPKITHTHSFITAKENMNYDSLLFTELENGTLPYFFRYYSWQTPGITYPQSVQIPDTLQALDSSTRTTGGGIVFHCPNDSVFSMGFHLKDPLLPSSFKDKLTLVSDWFGDLLLKEGYLTQCNFSESSPLNRSFCLSYPNPYERYFNNQKVVAFAMKRVRHMFMIQGIIHRESTHTYFNRIQNDYSPFFTTGLVATSHAL